MDIIVPIIVFIIFCILFSICGWCCRKNRQGTVYQYNGTPITITSTAQPTPVVIPPYPVDTRHPVPQQAPGAGFVPAPYGAPASNVPYPLETRHPVPYRPTSPTEIGFNENAAYYPEDVAQKHVRHASLTSPPYPTEARHPLPGRSSLYSWEEPVLRPPYPVEPNHPFPCRSLSINTAPYPVEARHPVPTRPVSPFVACGVIGRPMSAPPYLPEGYSSHRSRFSPGYAYGPPPIGIAPGYPAGPTYQTGPYPPAGAPYPPSGPPYPGAAPYPPGAAAPPPSYSEAVAQPNVPPNAPLTNEQYGKQSPYNPNY